MKKAITLLALFILNSSVFALAIKPIPSEPQKKDIASISAFKQYVNNTIKILDSPNENSSNAFVNDFNALTLSGLLQEDHKTFTQKTRHGQRINYFYFNEQGQPEGNIYTIIKSENAYSKKYILNELKKMYLAIIKQQRIVDLTPFPKITGFGYFGPADTCKEQDKFSRCLFTYKKVNFKSS